MNSNNHESIGPIISHSWVEVERLEVLMDEAIKVGPAAIGVRTPVERCMYEVQRASRKPLEAHTEVI